MKHDYDEIDIADFEDPLPCPLCNEMLRHCDCPADDIEAAWHAMESRKEIDDMNRESRFNGVSI